jgi:hypothetical protein
MGSCRTGLTAALLSTAMCILPGLLLWRRHSQGNSSLEPAALPAVVAGAGGAHSGWVLVAAVLLLILVGLRLPGLTLEVIWRSTYA